MIDYLYGSKSIGVRNYTYELCEYMSDHGMRVNLRGVGGEYVLGNMNQSQLRDHLISRVSDSDSTVLHVQVDSLMFRGNGDRADELDNLKWFLDQMLIRYKQVFVTFHGKHEFLEMNWIKDPIGSMLQLLLRRSWFNSVIPTLNRCKVLVHSEPHVQLLKSQGCDTVQLFIHPTNRHRTPASEKSKYTRVVIPGVLSDYKRVIKAMHACTRVPNCVLSIDMKNRALFDHYAVKARELNVSINPVQWSESSSEYLDQLSAHDVALITYNDDVPLSGSIIDALRCGLTVGVIDTPSFRWFAEQFQCIIVKSHPHDLGDSIKAHIQDDILTTRDAWHANNYFTMSHASARRLIEQYTGTEMTEQQIFEKSHTTYIKEISKQIGTFPRHMTSSSECAELIHTPGLTHVEHMYRYKPEKFADSWAGVIHGPFTHTETTFNHISTDQMRDENALDNCIHLHTTNTRLKELIEPHVRCKVYVLKMKTFPLVDQFDLETHLSKSTRHIIIHGWWCKNFMSFGKLNVGTRWEKLTHYTHEDPTLELMDMVGGVHESIRRCDVIPDNCIHFVDQTTDDVVDEQMLHCIRSNTPVLIRRNATTEEYLGSDYVLMFDDIKTAGNLLTDDNIKLAHEQLKFI